MDGVSEEIGGNYKKGNSRRTRVERGGNEKKGETRRTRVERGGNEKKGKLGYGSIGKNRRRLEKREY